MGMYQPQAAGIHAEDEEPETTLGEIDVLLSKLHILFNNCL